MVAKTLKVGSMAINKASMARANTTRDREAAIRVNIIKAGRASKVNMVRADNMAKGVSMARVVSMARANIIRDNMAREAKTSKAMANTARAASSGVASRIATAVAIMTTSGEATTLVVTATLTTISMAIAIRTALSVTSGKDRVAAVTGV